MAHYVLIVCANSYCVFPSLVSEFFGLNNLAKNYGVIDLGFGIFAANFRHSDYPYVSGSSNRRSHKCL